jgi:nitroreductase
LVLAAGLALGAGAASPSPALADDIALPPPVTEGGLGLFSALKKRSSVPGGDISPAEVTLEELSTVLWAASGLNRGQTGWTVPMAEGLPPYVRIYVAGRDGVWLYDWAEHKLAGVSSENIKAGVASQAFVAKAWYVLILVSDKEVASRLGPGAPEADNFIQVLTGAMTQDIYLAAASLGLGARYIHSMRADRVREALSIAPDDYPVALMVLGR